MKEGGFKIQSSKVHSEKIATADLSKLLVIWGVGFRSTASIHEVTPVEVRYRRRRVDIFSYVLCQK